jgi:putative oxidoreductase
VAAEFLGGLCILFGLALRPVALLMVVFVVFTAVLGHPFWAADAAHYQAQYINFMKNIAIMGGFLALFVSGPGRISLDRALWSQR